MKTIHKKTFTVEYVIPETDEEEKEMIRLIQQGEDKNTQFKDYKVIDNRKLKGINSYKFIKSTE